MINQLHLAMIELYKGDAKRIQHFCKVHSYAKLIAETENVDKNCQFIIEAAALTHDIGIHICEEKYGSCNGKLQEKEGPAIAEKLLGELGFDRNVSERVQYLIALLCLQRADESQRHDAFSSDRLHEERISGIRRFLLSVQ